MTGSMCVAHCMREIERQAIRKYYIDLVQMRKWIAVIIIIAVWLWYVLARPCVIGHYSWQKL